MYNSYLAQEIARDKRAEARRAADAARRTAGQYTDYDGGSKRRHRGVALAVLCAIAGIAIVL